MGEGGKAERGRARKEMRKESTGRNESWQHLRKQGTHTESDRPHIHAKRASLKRGLCRLRRLHSWNLRPAWLHGH